MAGAMVHGEPVKELHTNETALTLFERLASRPDMNVESMERLMLMVERQTARVAEEQFNAAMSKCQAAMRQVSADAHNPQTRSRYASYAAIDKALRPIYTDHGFAVSFNTEPCDKPEYVRLVALVPHSAGFSRTYTIDMPADGKGAKGGDVMTKTHAVGAGISYGCRYLLKMIFNVAVGEDDRDGNDPPAQKPSEPDDYIKSMDLLSKAAAKGQAAFASEWASTRAVRKDITDYATQHDRAKLEGFKAVAQMFDKKGGK